ncbi:YMGG-like glycine zipper-containing protein [Ferruginibacter yonginensis]|uniref:YMGG-like glycine zipper-containing protein n=1 Tax=Ferruginibacter yonginensis TaxID=1310416 RepID=A0ABV8QSQ2_9BACT
MKRILLMSTIAATILAACNSKKEPSLEVNKNIVFTDTAALRLANGSTDVAQPTTAVATTQPSAKPQVQTITKIVRVIEKQPAPAPVVVNTPAPPVETPKAAEPTTTAPANTGEGTTASTGNTTATTPVEAPKKPTGWSEAAKGATIGGVGGAVAGAVIGKGGKGAIIGGVIGAAGGYILGRKADKKSGRANVTTNTTP